MRPKSLLLIGLLLGAVVLMPAGCTAALALASGSVAAASSDCWQPTPSPTPSASGLASGAVEAPVPDQAEWCDIKGTQGAGGPWVDVDPATISAPNLASASAVATALSAVGRGGRSIAEGNGPVDFDCSGLTSFAWRAAGVPLVDYSFAQWRQTQRIPRSAVAPGDLVFWFGGDVHHVAIVTSVEGGQVRIAEAANPQDGLRVRALGGSWDDSYLSGFGRVVVA